MTETDRIAQAEWTNLRCPRCGASLLASGERAVCSYVGSDRESGCHYGIDAPVFLFDPIEIG